MTRIDFTKLYTEVKERITNNTLQDYILAQARILPAERNLPKDIQNKINLLNEITDCILIMQNGNCEGQYNRYLSLIENETTRLKSLLEGV